MLSGRVQLEKHVLSVLIHGKAREKEKEKEESSIDRRRIRRRRGREKKCRRHHINQLEDMERTRADAVNRSLSSLSLAAQGSRRRQRKEKKVRERERESQRCSLFDFAFDLLPKCLPFRLPFCREGTVGLVALFYRLFLRLHTVPASG